MSAEWFVRIEADRDYHELVAARRGGEPPVEFPAGVAPREVVLRGDEIRIGRRGERTPGADAPGIDLTGPPRDPGVSHLHAVLMALPSGRWVVIDPGSTNGTTMNYGEQALAPDTPVSLAEGDSLHVGAWTTLTVGRRAAAATAAGAWRDRSSRGYPAARRG